VNADTGVIGDIPGQTGTERTWTFAEDNAEAIGGQLVTINDADENAWLLSTFFGGSTPLVNVAAFIGLYQDSNQAAPDVGWHWISGDTASYRNWAYTDALNHDPNDNPNTGEVLNEANRENYSSMRSNGWFDSGQKLDRTILKSKGRAESALPFFVLCPWQRNG
jgi:hypothetical protein